jgi:hypothetical protein
MSTLTTIRVRKGQRVPMQLDATISQLHGEAFMLLTINQGKRTDAYLLQEISAAEGRGFHLARVSADSTGGHQVFLSANDERFDSCSCPGFTYTNRCKHHDALRGLLDNGELPQPAAEPDDEAQHDRHVAEQLANHAFTTDYQRSS